MVKLGELKGQAYAQAPMLGAKRPRLRGKQAKPRGPSYLLSGESLDAIGDLLYNKQLLRKQRYKSSKMPDVSLTTTMGREYFGEQLDQHGMLPTEVTKRRLQGKQAAKPYKYYSGL